MCFSQPAPRAPQIVYQGPSQADLDAQAAALETYRQQSTAQQQQFSAALQTQINEANQRAQEMADQLTASAAAAASENAAIKQASYAVNTAQVTPTNAMTTEPPKPKKKEEKGTLRIGTAAVSTTPGTGLNIGV